MAHRLDGAVALVATAAEQFRRRALYRRPALVPLLAGMTYRVAGRLDEAVGHADDALTLARRLGARAAEADALALSGAIVLEEAGRGGDVHEGDGRREEADARYRRALIRYREALGLAEGLGMRPLVAHCQLGLGNVYRGMRKRESAREHLESATAMYRAMAMRRAGDEAEAALRES